MRVLAVTSAVVLAFGVGLVYLPAGLIAAGLEGLAASYTWAYLQARTKDQTRRPPR